ncbi:MAG: tetratricopeptide repeat protein [Spirochaetes bacterium]|nr:tetratricopeptide repeat protein [Spirochaetota bacterium]
MLILIIATVSIALFVILIFFRVGLGGKNKKLKEGMRLEAAGKYHEALGVYDYLLKNGHLTPELRWKIANTALRANLVPRAQKELSVLLETKNFPANVSILAVKTLMAECYMKSGQLKEAFVELIEISKVNPDNYWAQFELGKIYAGQRKTGEAIKLFERCFQQRPNDHEINYFLGKAYLDYGNPNKAIEYFEKTARLKYFNHGKIDYYLGILYFSQKKYNIAIQHFTQVIKLRPNDNKLLSDSHHLIALCYKEKGLIDEAIRNLEKSQVYSELLPKDAQNKRALYNQGVLLYKKGQYQKALEKFYRLKMLDYKYKDVDKIIKTISLKLKNSEKIIGNIANYINENPLLNILKRGLLFSKIKFNIDSIEAEAEKYIASAAGGGYTHGYSLSDRQFVYNSINKFNNMPTKQFKDLARKLLTIIGFQIKSEPKFLGDNEYIDGNAINFFASPLKNVIAKKEILITVRRYKETVTEFSVSRFLEWLDESGLEKGIFIASSTYSTPALKVISMYLNVKFIDRSGLAKILGRIG